MTGIEKLITTARRYCIDNYAFWMDKYTQKNSGNCNPYSDEDYDLFPRYNVLTAIRQGVEIVVGQDFSSFEICKQTLKGIGKNSNSIFTINSNEELHLVGESARYCILSGMKQLNPIEKNAILDERKKFIDFVETRTPENVSNVEPLPYRRRLTDKKMLEVRQKLLEKWNYDGDYWNPEEDRNLKKTVFLMNNSLTLEDRRKIMELLIQKSDGRLYKITEERIDYEIEFDSFDFDLSETIVTDKTFEWVIYGSHESTIEFGSDWLTEFIENLFAERKDKLNKWEQYWLKK